MSLKRLSKIDEKTEGISQTDKSNIGKCGESGKNTELGDQIEEVRVNRVQTIYLAPDGSTDEMKEHKKLVANMKQLIISDPTKYHYIKNNKVISVGKNRDGCSIGHVIRINVR